MSPPTLFSPVPRGDLNMHLAVSDHAVSAVQYLVYYISKTLVDAETWYLSLEKLALALVHVTRKLPHYFQAHMIYVLTKHPLQLPLRFDFMGRVAKWGTRLRSFDVRFKPHNAIKGQVLADFVVDFTPTMSGMDRFPSLIEALESIRGRGV